MVGYDTVITLFTKSGNHQSSFTRAAMLALRKEGPTSGASGSDDDRDAEVDSDADDDEIEEENLDDEGMEAGGFCRFTTSLPVVYLRMWLNEKPEMTSVVEKKYLMKCSWILSELQPPLG